MKCVNEDLNEVDHSCDQKDDCECFVFSGREQVNSLKLFLSVSDDLVESIVSVDLKE